MSYKESTWIIIKNSNDEILFLKRKSNWLWTMPWWKVEKWESIIDWFDIEELRNTKTSDWVLKIVDKII